MREMVGKADGVNSGIPDGVEFVDSVLLMRIALVAFGLNSGWWVPFRVFKKQSGPTLLLGMKDTP